MTGRLNIRPTAKFVKFWLKNPRSMEIQEMLSPATSMKHPERGGILHSPGFRESSFLGAVEKAFVKGATPLSPLVRGAFLPTPSSGGIAFTPLTRGDRGVAFTSRKGCPLYSLKRGLFQQPHLNRIRPHFPIGKRSLLGVVEKVLKGKMPAAHSSPWYVIPASSRAR